MPNKTHRIALGKRLRSCDSFRCLGVKPNWGDYPSALQKAIRGADKIYYPSPLYEDLFRSIGKAVFPGNHHRFMGNKIRQTALFQLLGISHPRTRLYYGRRRQERICRDFGFPFVAKTPIGSSRGTGVWLIRDDADLRAYLGTHRPAYVQEYLPIDRDLRVVLIGGQIIHCYWRIQCQEDFRNNVSCGASISYAGIPGDALDFARDVADRCGFDEVGLDICHYREKYYVIEANMVFGLEGFRQVGLDLYRILSDLDRAGRL